MGGDDEERGCGGCGTCLGYLDRCAAGRGSSVECRVEKMSCGPVAWVE